MDVHCSTCGEPWDVLHLWHDAIFETGLDIGTCEAWQRLPHSHKLFSVYRKAFRSAGWEFGRSVINVVRCPSCPKDAKPNPDRLHIKTAIEEMLGDDEDGIAATFEDHHL